MSSVDAISVPRRAWRAPLLPAMVLVYAGLAAALFPATYVAMLADYIGQMGALLPLLILCVAITGLILSPAHPVDRIAQLLRSSAARLFALLGLAAVGFAGFTTAKLNIPHVVPFYADPALADLDRLLHGTDPGEALHRLIPGWLGFGIAYLYGPVWFLCWFGFMGVAALHPDPALRQRYFWVLCSTVLALGTVAATLFSSTGPYLYQHFYALDRFAVLSTSIDASAVGDYMRTAAGYLLSSYNDSRPSMGTGISAMPSMHLAIGTLNALLLSKLHRAAGALGWCYLGLLLVGSVYLGWHYAIDGYVSIAVVSLLWVVIGRFKARA